MSEPRMSTKGGASRRVDGTTQVSFPLGTETYEAARAIAFERHESLSCVLRGLIERCLQDVGPDGKLRGKE